MSIPVLTAVTGAVWEADFVAGVDRDGGLHVIRRCVDIADLLAAASTGTARTALVWAGLRRLDRDAVDRMAGFGVALIGLVDPGDTANEHRLRQLGLSAVLPADSPSAELTAAVVAAAARPPAPPAAAYSSSTSASSTTHPDIRVDALPANDVEPGSGRLLAVWGPTGAPGRTTVAVEVASELATLGVSTLLADADVYGGVVSQLLGLLDESPGLAAATRLANNGQLDVASLARTAPLVEPGFRVLTGVSRAARWPELRPAALGQVWTLCRSLAAWTVVDCGFAIEEDEELSFDTSAPRRNGATLETLRGADEVAVVGSADPVGVQRLVRGLADLREAAPKASVTVVVNRLRRGSVGPDPRQQVTAALEQHSGVTDILFVPYDRAALDEAMLRGRVLAEVAPESAVRRALAAVAAKVAGVEQTRASRRRWGSRWR